MDKETLNQKLNEFLGKNIVHVKMPHEFLSNLKTIIIENNKSLIVELQKKNNDDVVKALQEENAKLSGLFLKLQEAIKANRIDRVEIRNWPAPIEIPEVKFPEYPKEIEIKKPAWYEKFVPDKILEYIKAGFEFNKKSFESALDRHKEKENALAVRLVDKEGKEFYTAMFTAMMGGINSSDLAKEVTLQSILTELQGGIAIDAGDIEIGAVELKDGDTDTRVDIETDGTKNAIYVQTNKVIPGTAATSLGKAEDAAHTTGDTGVMALGVRNDGGAASAANGDYIPIPVSEFSSVVGVPVHVVGDSDKYVRGNLAHDAIDTASDPVNIGGTAASSIPTAVAAGDRVRSYFDTYGQQHIIKQNDLVPSQYDYIGLTYTGSNLTGVVYKTGGGAGTTVATLALAYTGSQLDSITKT